MHACQYSLCITALCSGKAALVFVQSRWSMEASFDSLNIPEKRAQYATKGNSSPSLQTGATLHGLSSTSAQKQQIIVPSCSITGRSTNFRVCDNSGVVKKNFAPIAVVLSKDQRVAAKSNRSLPPLLFLSNDSSKNGSSNSQGKTHHSQRPPTSLYAKKTTTANQSFGRKEILQSERDSSIEAEDSLGTLLSRHFEPDTSEDNVLSPNLLIAKRRILHEKARVRHVCSVCNRECPSKHKLKRHLSTHTEDRPFVCDACGKTFKWIGYLQKHIRQQHSNCIDMSPTSPLMTSSSMQSHMVSDSIFTASPSPPHIYQKRHKKHKSKTRHTKSSRCRSYGEALVAANHSVFDYHRHRKKSKLHKSSAHDENATQFESQHNGENASVRSLIVSIPRFHNVSATGASVDSATESPQEKDPIDLSMGSSTPSSTDQNSLSSPNLSNALSAIMAEPVPSCIQANRIGGMNASTGFQDSGSIQNQGADFGKNLPYSFSMNLGSTSSSNADSLLTPEYGHNQLLNSYSPRLQQSIPNSMDASNSAPATKDSINFSTQQDSPTTIGNFSIQPPDLIPVAPQFNSFGSDLNFDQQLNNMMDFSYSDPLSQSQYRMYGNQVFDGDSTMDDLNGLNYSPGLGMIDNFMAAPSYLDIQQARQLLFDNSQQMQRIMRSYQTLQNTLLRVTAGGMLNPGPNFNGLVDDQGLGQHQHSSLPMDQQEQQLLLNHTAIVQPSPAIQVPQTNSHLTGLQNQPQAQVQNYLNQPQVNHVQDQSQGQSLDQLNRVQAQLGQIQNSDTPPLPIAHSNQMQSQDILSQENSQYEDDLLIHLQNLTSSDPQDPSETTLDTFENPTCEPDDLLTPILCENSPEIDYSPPVERYARSDDEYDVGIQCELGPETIVALIEEEGENNSFVNQTEEPNSGSITSSETDALVGNSFTDTRSILLANTLADPPVATSTPPTLVSMIPPALISSAVPKTQSAHSFVSSTKRTLVLPPSAQITRNPVIAKKIVGTVSSKVDRMVNKYRCNIDGCVRAYLHRKDLTRHIKIRHGTCVLPKVLKPVAVEAAEKPYVCSMVSCGRSYHHMRDLRRHQRNCHENNSTTEADTQVSVKDSTEEFNLYGKIQLRFPCDFPECVRSYVHKKDLVRHKRLYHKDQSFKPSVPVPLPYSDTDLQNIRQEVKQEVEQMMKKDRLNSNKSSCESLCSSVSSTSTDTSSSVFSPNSLISSLNSDVFVSLGVVPPLIKPFKETSDSILNTNTAQILTLIQSLTSSNPQTITDAPQLPITVPVIPRVTDKCINKSPKAKSSSCETLKQVLSKPSKIVVRAIESETKHRQTKKANVISLHDQSPAQDISLILDLSSQSFMDSLQSHLPEMVMQPIAKQSPDTLANLAVTALTKSETDLSSLLIGTVSMPTLNPSPLVAIPHTDSVPPTQTVVPAECMITPEFSSPLEPCFSSEIVDLDTRKALLDTVLAIELTEETCGENLSTAVDRECSILIT